jgi:hypothetical protein
MSILITGAGAGEYAFSAKEIQPPPRTSANDLDAGSWSSIRVSESKNRSGPWMLIGEAPITPPDNNPARPQTRFVSVAGATLAAGWFMFELLDEDGNVQPLLPLRNGQSWWPSVQEVANLMPDRTTIDGGGEARTFNDDTTPTAGEVDSIIDMVLDAVDPRVPTDAPDEVLRAARHVVTLQTAIIVESGNWGDQLDTNQARVELWERLLTTHQATLDGAADGDLPGGPTAFAITTPTDNHDAFCRTGRRLWDGIC